MQLIEAYRLQNWVDEEITAREVLPSLQQLQNVLNKIVAQPNNPRLSFDENRQRFKDAADAVDLSRLSLSQIQIIKVLEIFDNVGRQGVERLDAYLAELIDIKHVADNVSKMVRELSDGITKIGLIAAALEPIIDDEPSEIESGQVLARFIFENDAAIDDIDKLRKWSDKLFHIGRGFAIAHKEAPQSVRVVGATTGSLIFEITASAVIVGTIAKAIGWMLDSMVKYRDFQLKSAEVRALKTKYPEQTDEFEADANKWDERAQMVIEQISESVAQKVKNSLIDFDKNQSNELEKAVSNLVYLYAQGGSVDCPGPDDEEDDDQSDEVRKAIGEIRQDFKRIREMQGQLKIQHLPIADPDE